MEDQDFLHEEDELEGDSADDKVEPLERDRVDNPDDPHFQAVDDDETSLPEDFDAEVDPDVDGNIFPSAP